MLAPIGTLRFRSALVAPVCGCAQVFFPRFVFCRRGICGQHQPQLGLALISQLPPPSSFRSRHGVSLTGLCHRCMQALRKGVRYQ